MPILNTNTNTICMYVYMYVYMHEVPICIICINMYMYICMTFSPCHMSLKDPTSLPYSGEHSLTAKNTVFYFFYFFLVLVVFLFGSSARESMEPSLTLTSSIALSMICLNFWTSKATFASTACASAMLLTGLHRGI